MNEPGPVQSELWRVTALLNELPAGPAHAHRADDLARWFVILTGDDQSAHREAEEAVWGIWCDHHDDHAKKEMVRGIRCLAEGKIEASRTIFEGLIALFPEWAEAWNKRATVHFLQGRDAASIVDIGQTLLLEPRHFGALGGLTQICLRNGNPDAATATLRHLRRVNPQAPGVDQLIEALRRRAPNTMH